ncbi:ABC transporter permease [Streptantibioticus parmotrematis]|uniref:ABC transporter permease n=1 Tax=Streptantibioticus parmotrematis TaxID=2873249 RepID=UPI0033F1782D
MAGLALAVALVLTTCALRAGTQRARDEVLRSAYGTGTDLTVTRAAPGDGGAPGLEFAARVGPTTRDGDRVTVRGPAPLDASAVAKVAAQPGVARAAGGLALDITATHGDTATHGGRATHGGGAQLSAYGVDVTAPELGPLSASTITRGSAFTAAQSDEPVAVADSGYALAHHLGIGSSVTLAGTAYRIVGIATTSDSTAPAQLYLPLRRAQALAGTPGAVGTVYVTVSQGSAGAAGAAATASGDPAQGVAAAIRAALPGTTVSTSADLASNVSGPLATTYRWTSGPGGWAAFGVAAAAVVTAAILMASAIGRRGREYATLRALGWGRARIARQAVGLAGATGLIGAAAGLALGLTATRLLTAIGPTLTAHPSGSGASRTRAGDLAAVAGSPGDLDGLHAVTRGAGHAGGRALSVALTAPVSSSLIALAAVLALGAALLVAACGAWRVGRPRVGRTRPVSAARASARP